MDPLALNANDWNNLGNIITFLWLALISALITGPTLLIAHAIIPSAVATYQAAVRTKANEHTTAINAAANINALAALTVEWPSEPE